MPSQIKVDQIAGATGSTVTLPSGQTLDLSSGTVNLPSTSLSTLNATNLTTGTVPNARLSGITADKLDLISTASVPSVTAKGTVGVSDGYIQLNCEYNSHGIKIKSPPHSAGASYTMVMPNAIGTSNQVLKMNSGATALEFATPSGGSYNFLGATGFQSNVASVDLNGFFTSDYDVYKIFLSGIYGASATTLRLRVNTTGSYTTQTAGNYNSTVVYNLNNGGVAYIAGDIVTSESSFYLAHIGTTAASSGSAEVTIYNPMSTSLHKNFLSHTFGNNSAATNQRFNIIGSNDWAVTTAITGVRFLGNTANLYFTNIRIYGIKNN